MKYKQGEKMIVEITEVKENSYVLNRIGEVEPMEAKIHEQAIEITRLIEENAKLKKEADEEYILGANAEYERWKGHASRIRAEGQNEAWKLARKIVLGGGGYSCEDLKKIFDYGYSQAVMRHYTYPEAAAKVEAWEKAKEKPQKTMMQDFLEKYPKAYINPLGAPPICPHNLGYKKQNCVGDCLECWSRPLEQIGGESDA